VTDVVDQKMRAVFCQTSQNGGATDVQEFLDTRVGPAMVRAGERIGVRYAECYLRKPIREV